MLLCAAATDPSASGMGFNTVTIPSPGNNVAAGTISQPLVFDQALFSARPTIPV